MCPSDYMTLGPNSQSVAVDKGRNRKFAAASTDGFEAGKTKIKHERDG